MADGMSLYVVLSTICHLECSRAVGTLCTPLCFWVDPISLCGWWAWAKSTRAIEILPILSQPKLFDISNLFSWRTTVPGEGWQFMDEGTGGVLASGIPSQCDGGLHEVQNPPIVIKEVRLIIMSSLGTRFM